MPNLKENQMEFGRSPLFIAENFIAYYGVPLIAKGHVLGVLEMFHRSELHPDADWLNFLNMVAGQAAIAIDSAMMFRELQRSNVELSLAYDATIEGLSRALDLRDKETEEHTRRVSDTAVELAVHLGVEDANLIHIRRGAILHDIGKVAIPDRILFKPQMMNGRSCVVTPVLPWTCFHPYLILHQPWRFPTGIMKNGTARAIRIVCLAKRFRSRQECLPWWMCTMR